MSISRKDAIANGEQFYTPTKPCKNGSMALRRTNGSACQCLVCIDEQYKKNSDWKSKNLDQLTAYSKARYANNRTEELARQKAYREANHDKLKRKDAAYRANNKDKISQYRSTNKDKIAKIQADWYNKNKEKKLDQARAYRADNSEILKERSKLSRLKLTDDEKKKIYDKQRQWRILNDQKMAAYFIEYRSKNRDRINSYASKRRAAKRERLPVWFGELDQFVMQEAAALAAERTEQTGIEWHVDHMIPMQARKASGLHCADNIQVIPALLNRFKSNKMIATCFKEWILFI